MFVRFASAFVPTADSGRPVFMSTRKATVLSAMANANRDFNPFATLSLDTNALQRCQSPTHRARKVRRAFRAAAFRCHPDTGGESADAEAFMDVRHAAELLGSEEAIELALKAMWRRGVAQWTPAQVARYLRDQKLSDAVVKAFLAEVRRYRAFARTWRTIFGGR